MADNTGTAKDKTPDPGKVAADAAKAVEPSGDAYAFPVERLISEGYQLLGHDSWVVAGAMFGISKKNLTLDEARAAVDAWLAAPIVEG